MQTNVGGIDKIARIVVGIALIVWAIAGGPVWAWIGVLPLATGLLGWCLQPARHQDLPDEEVGLHSCVELQQGWPAGSARCSSCCWCCPSRHQQ